MKAYLSNSFMSLPSAHVRRNSMKEYWGNNLRGSGGKKYLLDGVAWRVLK